MTVPITGSVKDVTGVEDNDTPWSFASVIRFAEDGSVITEKPREVRAVSGNLKVNLVPGYAIVTYGKQVWQVTVPETATTLKALIEAGVAFPPDTAQDLLDAAVGQYVEANREQFRTRAVPVVGDPTMAQWVDENGAEIGDPVPWSQVISEDVVAVAAEEAVTADIAGRDMLEGDDQRVPVIADSDGDWVAAGTGPAGEFYWGIHADGTFESSAMTVGDDAVTAQEDVEDLLWAPVVFSDNTYGEIHMDADGRVQQWALDAWAERMSISGSPDTVHVLIGMGQSNMSGRGTPTSAEIDPPDPRIFQYGAHATDITQATVPLDMVDTPSGVSPLTLIAREYVQRLPTGDVILLIPAARGSSTLGTATETDPNGVWNAAYTGTSDDLYGMAKAQIDAALAAVSEKWPNATKKVTGMFWHQGEGNLGTSESDYATRFDAIVSDLRTHLSDPDLPVVLGGMVTEWVETHSGLENIVAAHVDTPSRVVRTGYAYPPANGGGAQNLLADNQVHFNREALGVLSSRMLTAWDRALRNTLTSVPNVPQRIEATLNGTTLMVNWSQPMCRYTGFTVEYSANGGAWTDIPTTTVDTTAVATISGTNPVTVRLSVTNEVGTTVTSTPVYATIVKEP